MSAQNKIVGIDKSIGTQNVRTTFPLTNKSSAMNVSNAPPNATSVPRFLIVVLMSGILAIMSSISPRENNSSASSIVVVSLLLALVVTVRQDQSGQPILGRTNHNIVLVVSRTRVP